MQELSVGIDPGKAGGIAWIRGSDVCSHKMPDTPGGVFDLLKGLALVNHKNCHAYIEKVASTPQMGVVSAFTFGRGLGCLETALIAAKIPYDWVSPAKWQHKMQCLSKGNKNLTKRRAQELFPDIKITHANADALLIAEYGRRLRSGEFT